MCHFLPLIACTHACVLCYGKIITKNVCRSMWKAFVVDGSRKNPKSLPHISSDQAD